MPEGDDVGMAELDVVAHYDTFWIPVKLLLAFLGSSYLKNVVIYAE